MVSSDPVRALIDKLNQLVPTLRQYGEDGWADWLATSTSSIASGDMSGVTHLLRAYGGMGSFNDLIICPINGHPIADDAVNRVNNTIDTLRGEIWKLARDIVRQSDLGPGRGA